MKLIFTLSFFTFITLNCLAQDENDDDPINVELVSHIKSTTYIAAELIPLSMYFQPDCLGIGFGGRLEARDIADKFKIELTFIRNYGNLVLNETLPVAGDDRYPKSGANLINFSVGYALSSSRSTEKESFYLADKGNTTYYTKLPIKTNKKLYVNAGINALQKWSAPKVSFDQLLIDVNAPSFGLAVMPNSGQMPYRQNTTNLALGIERRLTTKTTYKTDRFGPVTNSTESSLYFDALINLSSEIPPLVNIYYHDETSNKETGTAAMTADQRADAISNLNELNFGFRAGFRGSHLLGKSFSYNVEFALNPGYYEKIFNNFQVQFGIGFRLYKDLKK